METKTTKLIFRHKKTWVVQESTGEMIEAKVGNSVSGPGSYSSEMVPAAREVGEYPTLESAQLAHPDAKVFVP